MNYRFDSHVYRCELGECPGWSIISTIYGMCCTFNSHLNNISHVYLSNQWGKTTGISIILNGKIATESGFNLFIHHYGEYVTKATAIFPAIPGYENFIRIHPRYERVSKHYSSLSLKQRACLLPTDRNLTLFQQSRCRLLSFANAIHKTCGCHPYFMPVFEDNRSSIRNCTIDDIHCFNQDSGNIVIDKAYLRRMETYTNDELHFQEFGMTCHTIACPPVLECHTNIRILNQFCKIVQWPCNYSNLVLNSKILTRFSLG